MKIKKIEELFCGGTITTPIAAVSVVLFTQLLLNLNFNFHAFIAAFLGGTIIYFFNRYQENDKDAWRKEISKNFLNKSILICLFVVFLIYLLIFSPNLAFLISGLSIVSLGVLYTITFKNFTKKFIGFKNVFVATIWGAIVLFSAFAANFFTLKPTVFIFLFIFFNLLAHEIILDMRDKENDREKSLSTLPLKMSPESIRIIIISLVALSVLSIWPALIQQKSSSIFLISIFSACSIIILEMFQKSILVKPRAIEPLLDIIKILWPIQILISKII